MRAPDTPEGSRRRSRGDGRPACRPHPATGGPPVATALSSTGSKPTIAERVHFESGPYSLEGELAYPAEGQPAGLAALAGPHPLLGGTMDNNVLRALGEGLAGAGRASLRFNFRGVGGSEGPALDLARRLAEFWRTSHVPQEADYALDFHGAVSFLLSAAGPRLPLALVGYSFGCSLLPAAALAHPPAALVLIAPIAGTHDLDGFLGLPQPKLVIAPVGDFASDEVRLGEWFDRLPRPRRLVRPRLDGHFFRGHEGWLVGVITQFLDGQEGEE